MTTTMNTATNTDTTAPAPAPGNSTTLARKATLGLTGILVLLATLFGAAGPASAAPAPAPGVYYGNQCNNANWWRNNNAGSEGCVFRNSWASGSWFNISAGAYDYARDGLSAKTDVRVEQYVNGNWVVTHTLASVVASSGQYYSRVGGAATIGRHSGATAFRIRIQVCNFDSPTGRHSNCVAGYPVSSSWNF